MAEATTAARRRRPRGDGSIYETASGRWRGAIVWEDPATGARRRHTVSGATFEAARDRMRELRRRLEDSGRPTSRAPLASWLAGWLEAERARVRPATWRAAALHVRSYIAPAIGRLRLDQVRPSDVERMTAGLVARGLSGQTARHARATLRRALADAQRDGLVASNAAALSRPPRAERREVRVLTAGETRALLEGTAADALGPLYALAATTGLRQGELLGLSWADVDGLGDRPARRGGGPPALSVRRSLARAASGWALAEPKTPRSRRTLELGPTAAAALRRQRARQAGARLAAGDLWQDREGLVFTDALGRPLSGVAVSKAFAAALARLGLPRVRFHDLRHGVASLLLAQGVPLKLVSEQLGHSTIAITADTYAHLDREQRRQAADALERAIGGAS